METYARAFFIGGILIPVFLHIVAPKAMPWWPDTVSTGIAFGVAAVVIAWKTRKDRESRRRLWNALRGIGEAIGRGWTSR